MLSKLSELELPLDLRKNTRILNLDDPMDNDNNIVPIVIDNELVEVRTPQGVLSMYRVTMLKIYFLAIDPNDLFTRNLYATSIEENGRAIYFSVPFVPSKIRKAPQKLFLEPKPLTKKQKEIAKKKNLPIYPRPPTNAEQSAALVTSKIIKDRKKIKR